MRGACLKYLILIRLDVYFFVDYINYGCFMQKSLYTERKLEGVVVNKVLIVYLRQILRRDCGNLLPILRSGYRMFAQEK